MLTIHNEDEQVNTLQFLFPLLNIIHSMHLNLLEDSRNGFMCKHAYVCFDFRFGFRDKLLDRVTFGWVSQTRKRKASGNGLMGPCPPLRESNLS